MDMAAGEEEMGLLIKRTEFIFEHLSRVVLRRPLIFVLTALVLTVLSAFVLATRFDVRSDLKDLMPEDARSVADTFKISERVGSISTLQIILETPDLELSPAYKETQSYRDCVEEFTREGRDLFSEQPPSAESWCDNALIAFGRDFVKALEAMDIVGSVQFHNDKAFFEKNALLYAPTHELERAYEEIDRALTKARQMSGEYKSCLIVASEEGECDDLVPSLEKIGAGEGGEGKNQELVGLKEQLLERYEASELSQFREFPLYQLADGAWMLRLELRFKDAATGLRTIQAHVKEISALADTLKPQSYHSALIIDYGGALKDMQNEYKAIINDIIRSVGLTIFNIFLLLCIFFRSIRVGLRILLPLIMGTLWTLALTFVTIGYLNLITAFIFAILLGLGIDYGIHLYVRFEQERRLGRATNEAMSIAMRETGTPIFFGTLTTMATFFTLLLSGFHGFSQFGLVAGVGVFIAFLTMIAVMPATVILMERLLPSKVRRRESKRRALVESTRRNRLIALGVLVAMLVLVGYGVSQIPEVQFEENFYRLQLKASADSQSQSRYKAAAAATRHASPAVILFDNTEQVAAFQMQLDRRHGDNAFYQIRRLSTFMPHTTQQITDAFRPTLPYLERYQSLIVSDIALKTLPYALHSALPLGSRYSAESSKVVGLSKAMVLRYPNFSRSLSEQLLSETLEQSIEWAAFKHMNRLASLLPHWALDALPETRDSDRLDTIKATASIFSFMPTTALEQEKRLGIIAKIAERTSDRNIRFLPKNEKEKIAQLRPYLVTQPVNIDDLPLWVKLQFKESGVSPLPPRPDSGVDFSFGNIALAYQLTSTYNGYQAHMFTDEIRSIRVEGKELVAATGAFVYSDILRLVQSDGVRIAFIAMALVLLIVFIQQRCFAATFIITTPLLSSIVLTILTMILFDLKLGIFNMVVLPVILGIGIDGSIYLYQRYRSLGRGSVFVALREVGGAVFMSSATTMVGFGSMVLSQHMGLNTMGQLSIIGISFCFLGTVLIMPGLICLAEILKLKSAIPDFDYDPSSVS
ncbi:MAG: MMPL family transporter [Bradymonadales bacterium]